MSSPPVIELPTPSIQRRAMSAASNKSSTGSILGKEQPRSTTRLAGLSTSLKYTSAAGFTSTSPTKDMKSTVNCLNEVRDTVIQRHNVLSGKAPPKRWAPRPKQDNNNQKLAALFSSMDEAEKRGPSSSLQKFKDKVKKAQQMRAVSKRLADGVAKEHHRAERTMSDNDDGDEGIEDDPISDSIPVKDLWTLSHPDEMSNLQHAEFGEKKKVPDFSTMAFWGRVELMDSMQHDLTWCADNATKRGDRMWTTILDERNKRMHGLSRLQDMSGLVELNQQITDDALVREREQNNTLRTENQRQQAQMDEMRTYIADIESSALRYRRMYNEISTKLQHTERLKDAEHNELVTKIEELEEKLRISGHAYDIVKSEVALARKGIEYTSNELQRARQEIAEMQKMQLSEGGEELVPRWQLLRQEAELTEHHEYQNKKMMASLFKYHQRAVRRGHVLRVTSMVNLEELDVEAETGVRHVDKNKPKVGPRRPLKASGIYRFTPLTFPKAALDGITALDKSIEQSQAKNALQMWRSATISVGSQFDAAAEACNAVWKLLPDNVLAPSVREAIHRALRQYISSASANSGTFIKAYTEGARAILSLEQAFVQDLGEKDAISKEAAQKSLEVQKEKEAHSSVAGQLQSHGVTINGKGNDALQHALHVAEAVNSIHGWKPFTMDPKWASGVSPRSSQSQDKKAELTTLLKSGSGRVECLSELLKQLSTYMIRQKDFINASTASARAATAEDAISLKEQLNVIKDQFAAMKAAMDAKERELAQLKNAFSDHVQAAVAEATNELNDKLKKTNEQLQSALARPPPPPETHSTRTLSAQRQQPQRSSHPSPTALSSSSSSRANSATAHRAGSGDGVTSPGKGRRPSTSGRGAAELQAPKVEIKYTPPGEDSPKKRVGTSHSDHLNAVEQFYASKDVRGMRDVALSPRMAEKVEKQIKSRKVNGKDVRHTLRSIYHVEEEPAKPGARPSSKK
eukprot:PhM_4_TR13325/c0_g1_i1/m.72706